MEHKLDLLVGLRTLLGGLDIHFKQSWQFCARLHRCFRLFSNLWLSFPEKPANIFQLFLNLIDWFEHVKTSVNHAEQPTLFITDYVEQIDSFGLFTHRLHHIIFHEDDEALL